MLSNAFAINSNSDIVVSGNGVAGTPDAGVQTIQGITGATPVPVSGTVTATNPSVGTTGATAPTSATLSGGIAATTGATLTAGNLGDLSLNLSSGLRVDGSAVTQPISAAALPLPTGAATAANQTSEITQLTAIASSVAGPTPAGTNAIGSVTVTASALPTGAATSANQAAQIALLSPSTSALTALTLVATTSTSVLASNSARKSFFLFNNSTTSTVFVAEAGTASAASWSYKILPQQFYESPSQCYTGAISYFATIASGTLQVTERS